MDFSFPSSSTSFSAIDLPLLTKRSCVDKDDGSIAGSETPSDLVSHISWGRVSGAVSTAGSEWLVNLEPTAPVSTEWFSDCTDLKNPELMGRPLPIPDATALFDMTTQVSESSCAPIKEGKVRGY